MDSINELPRFSPRPIGLFVYSVLYCMDLGRGTWFSLYRITRSWTATPFAFPRNYTQTILE